MDYFAPAVNAMNAYVQQGRQGNADMMAMREMDRKNRLDDMAYNKLKQAEDYKQGLKSAYADAYANPGESTIPNPAYVSPEQYQANIPANSPPDNYNPQAAYTNNDPMQGYDPVAPTITQANKPPDYLKFALDYAKKNGDGEQAQQIHDKVIADAVKMMTLNPMAAAQIVAKVADTLGEDIQYMGSKDNIIHIKEGETILALDPVTGKMTQLASNPKPNPEALLDKRFEQQQELQRQRDVAAEGRLTRTLTAKGQDKPGKTLPATTLSDLADAKTLITSMQALKDSKTIANTGPIAGRIQSALGVFGMASDSFTDVKSKLAGINNIMLKLRSGAAVTDGEYERFKQEMPNMNDPENVYTTKLSNALKYAQSVIDAKTSNFEEGGYKVPGNMKSGSGTKPPAGRKTASDPMGIL